MLNYRFITIVLLGTGRSLTRTITGFSCKTRPIEKSLWKGLVGSNWWIDGHMDTLPLSRIPESQS
jgi:hypothetical protein